MNSEGPVAMLVIYRAKPDHADELLALVREHWPLLRKLELATDLPARIWRACDRDGLISFVEMFEWSHPEAAERAHEMPEVLALWEPMTAFMDAIEINQVESC